MKLWKRICSETTLRSTSLPRIRSTDLSVGFFLFSSTTSGDGFDDETMGIRDKCCWSRPSLMNRFHKWELEAAKEAGWSGVVDRGGRRSGRGKL